MLKIGVIGTDKEDTITLINQIANNDATCKSSSTGHLGAIMNDNTRYYTLHNDLYGNKGLRLDQIILSDEKIKFSDEYKCCLLPFLTSSCVPEEFQVQIYEI